MTKGGRSRYTKRPTPVGKRVSAVNTSPKPPVGAAVTSTTKNHPTAASAIQKTPPTLSTPATAATKPTLAPISTTTRTSKATTSPPLSPVERWVSAFTRGFPYVLAEYCLFLLAVFGGRIVAIVVGAILLVLIASNRVTDGKVIARLPANVVREAEALLGRRDDVLTSMGIVGVGLLCWALWNIAGIMLFSWLSIIALLVALFLLFYAQRLQPLREA